MGERLAREIGGNFRIQGMKAIMSKRGGSYTAAVVAAWGRNLHGWDISPSLGRTQYSQMRARWYDSGKAQWQEAEEDTALSVEARHDHRYAKPDEDEAMQQTASDRATSERDAGEGSVTIEGDTAATPDGLCIVTGARPGIDGTYRIESVTHSYSRGGGFVTQLSLKQPGSGSAGNI
jgi:phage protein D